MAITEQALNAMSKEELQALIMTMKKAQAGKLTCKVSEKGAVSVYGMGKWPVTLYAGQWERLFAAKDQIEAFIEANQGSLATKD